MKAPWAWVLGPIAIALIGAFVMGALFLVLLRESVALWAIVFGETYTLILILLLDAKKGDIAFLKPMEKQP